MKIYVVIWNSYDDTELVGASIDKETAKNLKRGAVGEWRDINDIHIVEVEDGVQLLPWKGAT